ncbi:ABC transporter ATP-binding protein [Streptomyces sp. NPDC088785]|uniref:ABC transporter ATP-binding protein n=1 Tax=Streptomyces sp. NPDC088785 TaxID=3365897 RepID=UPI0038218FD3
MPDQGTGDNEVGAVSGHDILRGGLRIVARAARAKPRPFVIASVGSSVFAAGTVATAFVVGSVLSHIVGPAIREGEAGAAAAATAACVVAGVTLIKIAGIVTRRVSVGVMQYGLVADHRKEVARTCLRRPLSWFHTQRPGALLSAASSDVDAAWWAVADLALAVGAAVMMILALASLWLTDWVLALVGATAFPLLVAVNLWYSRAVSPRLASVQESRAAIADLAHENIEGAHVIRILGRADAEVRRFAAETDRLRTAAVGVGRARASFDPAVEALPQLATLALLLVGTTRLAAGAIEVADLVSSALLFSAIAFPLGALGWLMGQLPRSVVGWSRLNRILDTPADRPAAPAARPRTANAPLGIRARALSYDYGDGRSAVDTVDLEVPAGSIVAIAGPTGAGKTTLLHLMAGLLRPRTGECRIVDSGSGAGHGPLAEPAPHLSYVPQETFLFADSVRGNITLGAELSDDEIWRALRLARAEDIVESLPDGLDAAISERGGSLSGGQRQRIALARALARRPRLLLLDDATSALDPRVEADVMESLRRERGTTTVLVAHRRSGLALADEVIFMEHGRVRARDSHAQLVASEPAYRDLVQEES